MRSLFLVLVLYLASRAGAKSGLNPCHGDKGKEGVGVTCTGVILPPEMCSKCKLKPYLNNGRFADCASIYDLTNVECQQQLVLYAEANKGCDPVRYAHTRDFSNAYNAQRLDLFLYAVCEQCCDCVPIGASATVQQYQQRAAANTLLNVYRGNCPAHAHHDLCKMWPQVKYTTMLGNPYAVTHEEWPKVCPLVKSWIISPAGDDWGPKAYVNMDGAIARFLAQLMVDTNCSAGSTWLECTALEAAQQRV